MIMGPILSASQTNHQYLSASSKPSLHVPGEIKIYIKCQRHSNLLKSTVT